MAEITVQDTLIRGARVHSEIAVLKTAVESCIKTYMELNKRIEHVKFSAPILEPMRAEEKMPEKTAPLAETIRSIRSEIVEMEKIIQQDINSPEI